MKVHHNLLMNILYIFARNPTQRDLSRTCPVLSLRLVQLLLAGTLWWAIWEQ